MDSEFTIETANANREAADRVFAKLVNGQACTIVKQSPHNVPVIIRLDGKYIKSVGGNRESAVEWISTNGGTFVPYEGLNSAQKRTVEGLS
jgi:hypothetical protein